MGARGRLKPSGSEWRTLAEQVRRIGAEVNPRTIGDSAALIAALHPAGLPEDVSLRRDVAYGPHPRQRLDVFSPRDEPVRSVVVFVHGGAFVSGDKHRAGSPFHDNVGIWAARAGRLGVTINHRLAPDAPWPDAADDIALVMDWCARTATAPSGSPLPVHLIGTSSGAVHVGTSLTGGPGWEPRGMSPASAAFVSGVYDLPAFGVERVRSYFGDDLDVLRRWQLAQRLSRIDVPMLFAVGELDTPDAHAQLLRMLEVCVRERGTMPAVARARAANHFTIVNAIGSRFDDLGPELRTFHDVVDEPESP